MAFSVSWDNQRAALAENNGLSATALELRQQLCTLESALSAAHEEADRNDGDKVEEENSAIDGEPRVHADLT